MEGIISLTNAFSVGCIITGGRVSLAHLMELSHFVDLFVLEERIIMNENDLTIALDQFELQYQSPLYPLPHDQLVH